MIDYIRLISERSDDAGDLLLQLMDELGVYGLCSVTQQQAKDFCDKHQVGDLPIRRVCKIPQYAGGTHEQHDYRVHQSMS